MEELRVFCHHLFIVKKVGGTIAFEYILWYAFFDLGGEYMIFINGLLISTALYGILSLIVYSFLTKPSLTAMLPVALHPEGLYGYFIAFMIWSIPAFFLFAIVHYILVKISYKKWYPSGHKIQIKELL